MNYYFLSATKLTKALVLGLLLSASCSLYAQHISTDPANNTDHSDAYLGQNPPGNTPVIFAPNILSLSDRYEFGCTFSTDGKEMFFGVDNAGVMEIHHTRLEEGSWTAQRKLFADSPFSHNDPMYSPDEKQLFFISNRPLDPKDSAKDVDIWYVNLEGYGVSDPINVGSPINTPVDEYFVSFTREGKMYFSTRDQSDNAQGYSFDIYCAEYNNGRYQQPVKLPETINTHRYEADVFVAPDESYLIFCAIRRNGLGRGDLYISFKNEEGGWTEAKNMGETINSKNHELCPYVSTDGKYFFYTSNEDIYWVSTEVFDKYR